ncbi:hypothetical protein A6A03_06185 [Chloroflexus islandicus]|uniref:Uncharacterized protein n=1 Tax=Chloroflexus islandicus TaxID=1707952 RepID=A0A178LRE5_9CHLR|nr:hypothetical protein [Chloroflexus islandicus]OAN36335.1 hypothetical protein A6A03_06185 [Chloroflexus islandicus]
MCRKLTILARDSAMRMIAQCEHGTIHLYWTRAALFLHPADLAPLLALIQCWQPAFDEAHSEGFLITRRPDGSLQFWHHEIGLRLSEGELYDLAALLWHAAGRLKLLASSPSLPPRHSLEPSRPLTCVPLRPEWRN